jgi:hypothetical protein
MVTIYIYIYGNTRKRKKKGLRPTGIPYSWVC